MHMNTILSQYHIGCDPLGMHTDHDPTTTVGGRESCAQLVDGKTQDISTGPCSIPDANHGAGIWLWVKTLYP